MPRKRRQPLARRTLTLDTLTPSEELDLAVGWRPSAGRGRWSSWGEFFEDYHQVREEFLAGPSLGADVLERGRTPFAEANYGAWLAAGQPEIWEEIR